MARATWLHRSLPRLRLSKDTFWEAISAKGAPASDRFWKHFTGLACPHGRKIYAVSGLYVRNKWDSDFDQGGNGYRYPFIPKKEIWIDSKNDLAEWPYILFHECREIESMAGGASYDRAHAGAKRVETIARRRDWPGEKIRKRRSSGRRK